MDDITNVINVTFDDEAMVISERRFQYDYGQIISFDDLDLPAAFECHFANALTEGTTYTMIGSDNEVEVPDELFLTGKPIFAWVYLHDPSDSGRTCYTVKIPVITRPEPSNDEPTPVQQGTITQAIAALAAAVAQTGQDVIDAAQSASDAAGSAEAAATSEENAATSATNAHTSETNASESAENAATSATNAHTSEINAQDYATDASNSALTAATKAVLAESWAIGGTGMRSGEDTNNAKYYSELAAQSAEYSGYAYFEVDNETGNMMVTVATNLSQEVSFAVNENNGTLEVNVNG